MTNAVVIKDISASFIPDNNIKNDNENPPKTAPALYIFE